MYSFTRLRADEHVRKPLLCSKAAGCKAAALPSEMHGLAAEMLRSLKASHEGLGMQQYGGRQG